MPLDPRDAYDRDFIPSGGFLMTSSCRVPLFDVRDLGVLPHGVRYALDYLSSDGQIVTAESKSAASIMDLAARHVEYRFAQRA